jgi:hypothetical protein
MTALIDLGYKAAPPANLRPSNTQGYLNPTIFAYCPTQAGASAMRLEALQIVDRHHAKATAGRIDQLDKAAFELSARSRALLRGRQIAEADLRASGGAYELQAVLTMMGGVSRRSIERHLRQDRLLAVPGPGDRRRFPVVQFQSDGTVVNGLQAVRAALPTRNPWAVLNFLIQPDDRLAGRRPIDVLKAGGVAEVVEAARCMNQQGA